MQSIPRITIPAQSAERAECAELSYAIERNARLSGHADVLMRLDRIPGLLLGPSNRVSEGAEDAAMQAATTALIDILGELERAKNKQAAA
ncbi:hypothetical protein ABIC83_002653 [Roseateles asaccharophilus]|uniref:hypothetical protein n=1 Tax=Roseateles asaccharophilus TaxID=582607 RepID=UPI0038364FF4